MPANHRQRTRLAARRTLSAHAALRQNAAQRFPLTRIKGRFPAPGWWPGVVMCISLISAILAGAADTKWT